MVRISQNNTIKISSVARSKLYSNTNYILTIISNVSHIYEFSPRRVFRYVRILFGIPKLKRRNGAIKTWLNVIAADLKKLKTREIYREIKSRSAARWKSYILISERDYSAGVNPKRRSEFRNYYKIRSTYSNIYWFLNIRILKGDKYTR
jgi:hypothetical protein